MFLGFTNNTKISNNHKLLSHNNLSFFRGNISPSIFFFFFLENRTPILILFVKQARSSYDQSKPLNFPTFWSKGKYSQADTKREGIILGENPPEHCFVLKGLIPWKYVVYDQERDWVRHDTCCLQQTSLDAGS